MEGTVFIDWLLQPLDPTRPHNIGVFESWHGRLMVLGWGVLLPLGVVIARFFKIMPKQNWPNELDNRTWWRWHLIFQWSGAAVSLVGLTIILCAVGGVQILETPHHTFGWFTIALMVLQIFAGLFRGSKGGPTYPAPDGSWRGDHYDMTMRRKVFELSHKSLGYVALFCGAAAILLGMQSVNAPVWMWILIVLWWLVLIILAAILQKNVGAVDTYQAIWGPDPDLPGNQVKPIGFGITRRSP